DLEFDWIFQVGVTRKNNAISPLSLWERARVRALLLMPEIKKGPHPAKETAPEKR
ncbi:hypothetical protein PMI23_04922, partial [Pseudomonas sp. GM24]